MQLLQRDKNIIELLRNFYCLSYDELKGLATDTQIGDCNTFERTVKKLEQNNYIVYHKNLGYSLSGVNIKDTTINKQIPVFRCYAKIINFLKYNNTKPKHIDTTLTSFEPSLFMLSEAGNRLCFSYLPLNKTYGLTLDAEIYNKFAFRSFLLTCCKDEKLILLLDDIKEFPEAYKQADNLGFKDALHSVFIKPITPDDYDNPFITKRYRVRGGELVAN
ncbi:MAG: hypothetical protein UH241_04870 [Acutalibacteraceae bacterium]|nr:hypothetical protein [Acutalibacteraceae bacterium]